MASLIFDLDGTLANSKNCILNSIRFAMNHLGLGNLEFDEILALQQDLATTFGKISTQHELKADEVFLARFIELYRHYHHREALLHIELYADVPEVLKLLKPRFKLGVATTKQSDQAIRVLSQLGILEYFDHVQGTDLGMKYKPQPDVLYASINALGSDPSRTAYIGDSIFDMQAARQAGIYQVGAAYGFSGDEGLKKEAPHWLLYEVQELLDLQNEILGTNKLARDFTEVKAPPQQPSL